MHLIIRSSPLKIKIEKMSQILSSTISICLQVGLVEAKILTFSVASLLLKRKDSPVEHIKNERSHYFAFKKEFHRNLHAIEQLGTASFVSNSSYQPPIALFTFLGVEDVTGSAASLVIPVADNMSFLLQQYNELGPNLEVP